jgi:DNA-binding MarR family transcriptional regulator
MSVIVQHLTAIARCGMEYRKKYLESVGIDARYGRFLMEVCQQSGISQDGLARLLLVDKSTVTRISTALEESGYISRKCCPEDRRITRIYPTQKTMEILPALNDAWDSWEKRITKDLTQEEVCQLRELLQKMKTAACAYIEEG